MSTHILNRHCGGFLLAILLIAPPSAAFAQPLATAWVWTLPGDEPGVAGFFATDFDGDLREELLMASASYFGPSYDVSGVWSEWTLGATILQRWSSLPLEHGIQAMRLTPPPGDEIVIASQSRLLVFDGHDKGLVRSMETFVDPIEDFVVADLDGDSLLEVVLCDPYDLHVLDYLTGSVLATRWGFGCTDVEIGQTDADPALEIVLAGNPAGGLVLDGETLALEWDDLDGFGNSVVLADADGDSQDDIVTYRTDYYDYRLVALEPGTGTELWGIDAYDLELLGAGDVDGDSDLEILVDGGYSLGGLVALDENTGATLWSIPDIPGNVRAATIADLDGNGIDELAVAFEGDDSGAIASYDLQTLLLIERTPELASQLVDLAIGDIDGDGSMELVVGFVNGSYYYSATPRLGIFDVPLRRLAWLEPSDPDALPIVNITLGQTDADSGLEICLTRYDNGLVGVECQDGIAHTIEWALDLEDTGDALTIRSLQLDGTGPEEVLVATGEPFVWAFEGPSGWLRWRSPLPTSNADAFGQLRLGDITGDGVAELIAAGGGYSYYGGGLAVLDPQSGTYLAGPFDIGVQSLDLGQLDGDPGLEAAAGLGSYYSSDLVLIDPLSAATSSPLATFPEAIRSLRLVDMTDDGQPDFVILTDSALTILDGVDASEVWHSPPLATDASGDAALLIAELGGDSRPEIVVNMSGGFVIFGDPTFAAFADGFESGDFSAWSYVQP